MTTHYPDSDTSPEAETYRKLRATLLALDNALEIAQAAFAAAQARAIGTREARIQGCAEALRSSSIFGFSQDAYRHFEALRCEEQSAWRVAGEAAAHVASIARDRKTTHEALYRPGEHAA